ncbi:hypothetical protein PCH_Pc03g00100 [Penicillium rubens Wisconsin 54-1255]|uniref:Uncharacterized protein n=1 Tax=Penicillium rubens (strain ATCC 28089 / DSM 1075 / NRRL 1951 / Wisconsin 54-1255) TaxID=500485 RepID=B6GVQ9_PENRW|nr:hypothetical protein PCH_Pc03g00100 [Penicillium rubens Wisconsin 54-1255]
MRLHIHHKVQVDRNQLDSLYRHLGIYSDGAAWFLICTSPHITTIPLRIALLGRRYWINPLQASLGNTTQKPSWEIKVERAPALPLARSTSKVQGLKWAWIGGQSNMAEKWKYHEPADILLSLGLRAVTILTRYLSLPTGAEQEQSCTIGVNSRGVYTKKQVDWK